MFEIIAATLMFGIIIASLLFIRKYRHTYAPGLTGTIMVVCLVVPVIIGAVYLVPWLYIVGSLNTIHTAAWMAFSSKQRPFYQVKKQAPNDRIINHLRDVNTNPYRF